MADTTSTNSTHSYGDIVVHQGRPFRIVGSMHCHVTGRAKWMIHPTDIKTAVRESDCLWCDAAALMTIEQAKAALDAAH